ACNIGQRVVARSRRAGRIGGRAVGDSQFAHLLDVQEEAVRGGLILEVLSSGECAVGSDGNSVGIDCQEGAEVVAVDAAQRNPGQSSREDVVHLGADDEDCHLTASDEVGGAVFASGVGTVGAALGVAATIHGF